VSGAERQARRLLWLLPLWMRAERGEEAVGLILDLLPQGAARLPLRVRYDLVRAGLHARRRGTPPWWVWFDVMGASKHNRAGTVPAVWRPWLTSRINQRRFGLMWAAFRVMPALLPLTVVMFSDGGWEVGRVNLALIVGAMLIAWLGFSGRWRRVLRHKNGLGTDGRPVPAAHAELTEWLAACPNLPLRFFAWIGALVSGVILAGELLSHGKPLVRWAGAWSLLALAVPIALAVLCVQRQPRPRMDGPARILERPAWSKATADPVAWCLVGLVPTELLVAAAIDGAVGSITAPAAALLAFLVMVALDRRRERRLGRGLGVWEVVPSLGPRPMYAWATDSADVGPPSPA
jgi:hypothetical protein